MINKRPLRFKKTLYKMPTEPDLSKKKFRQELLLVVGERYTNFYNSDHNSDHNDDYYDEDEVEYEDEYMPLKDRLNSRQSMSLNRINDIVKKSGLDEKKVCFTASFSDDYLNLEIVHINEMTEDEILEEYKEDCILWEAQQTRNKEQELKRAQLEIECLQRKVNSLKNK